MSTPTRRPNLVLAARCAGNLVAELLSPFNHGDLEPRAVGLLQEMLRALNIDTLTVRDNAVSVADQANGE